MVEMLCKRKPCGYVWESRKPKPKACPRCKSYSIVSMEKPVGRVKRVRKTAKEITHEGPLDVTASGSVVTTDHNPPSKSKGA